MDSRRILEQAIPLLPVVAVAAYLIFLFDLRSKSVAHMREVEVKFDQYIDAQLQIHRDRFLPEATDEHGSD